MIKAGIFLLLVLAACSQSDRFYTNTQRSDVFTQSYNVSKIDFLWVLDNSNSMAPKRSYIAQNIQTFLDILTSRKAIDYQMAVVNVDYLQTPGALITGNNGMTVVKSTTSTNPASDFAAIVNNDVITTDSFWEQGLIQSYTAIQNNGSQFMRDGVPLAVIYVTDDDDWSCKGMIPGGTTCYGFQPENNPDVILYDTSFFIDFFKNLKAPQNTTVTLFPVIGLTNATCVVERVGTRYQNVAQAVGGPTQTGGLCPDSIGTSLNNIAQILADRGVRFPLSYPSNGINITVYVNSVSVPYSQTNGYYYDPSTNSIIFTGTAIPSNGNTVEVVYQQKTN